MRKFYNIEYIKIICEIIRINLEYVLYNIDYIFSMLSDYNSFYDS